MLQPLSVAAVQDYLDKIPEGKSWLDSAKDAVKFLKGDIGTLQMQVRK